MNICNNRQINLDSGFHYVLEYLKTTQLENPGFFYAIEGDVNVNNHPDSGNVFWVDANSRSNYAYFGDTVRIDTSYRTNRSKIPFVTFSGINHHAQPILFGCALLLNESDNTFAWLFRTWLQAMSGRPPVSITTDPDRLVQVASKLVLPDTRHRFCRWGIISQTAEKLANLYQNHPGFDQELNKCVNEADTVEEFESRWANLMGRYYLTDNEWLQSVYGIRDQWVPVYAKDVFFGELEMGCKDDDAISSFFDGFLSSANSIQSLIKQYEKAVASWHEKELKADFETYNSAPVLKTPSPMEKQAANIYTGRVFLKFQGELVETLANPATSIDDSGAVTTYRVAKFGEEHKAHIVRFDTIEVKASCSCRMFEFSGVICRHVLSVFRAKNVLTLPSVYVLKRWTRDAKRDGVSLSCGGLGSTSDTVFGSSSNSLESLGVRQENLRQKVVKFVEDGAKSIRVYNVAMNALHEASRKVVALKNKNTGATQGSNLENSDDLRIDGVENQPSSSLTREEKEKKIRELSAELNHTNQKHDVYRAVLLALLKDIEDQKLKLSVKVQNAQLSLRE